MELVDAGELALDIGVIGLADGEQVHRPLLLRIEAFDSGRDTVDLFVKAGSSTLAGACQTPDALQALPYTSSTPQVYNLCMARTRTNIEIDEVYVRRIMDRYGIHTKTEAVDLALRHLAGQPMSREEALAMEGAHAIGEVPSDSGALDSPR